MTCTHNSLSLSAVGLDVHGCEELQLLDRDAVAAKRFMSENVRTIGSHDMEGDYILKISIMGNALLLLLGWRNATPAETSF